MERYVLVIQHSPNVTPGMLAQFFEEKHIPYKVVKLYEGESLQNQHNYCAIVSLGGIMGAYDENEYPWLVEEKQFLRQNWEKNVPILGICLGCQLLADALGGKAFKGPKGHEVGFPTIKLTKEGVDDPTMSKLPVVADHQILYTLCHGDTWTLPPNAVLLAASETYPQVFRSGSALAVQFHPEATIELFDDWSKGVANRYKERGETPPYTEEERGQMIQFYKDNATKLREGAYALFQAWIDSWMSKI